MDVLVDKIYVFLVSFDWQLQKSDKGEYSKDVEINCEDSIEHRAHSNVKH